MELKFLNQIVGLILMLCSNASAGNGFNFSFFQNEYKLKIERGDVAKYNKEYVRIASLVSFKCNRTDIALNMTTQYKINPGRELEIVLQAYKFASNEYRLFPLRVGGKFCQWYEGNFGGAQKLVAKCGNYTGCSFVKDRIYHFCNFTPEQSKFPPGIPTGRYLWELEILYKSVSLILVRIYVEIARPEVKRYFF